MTIYILVETREGSPHARAAFSSEKNRQDYLDENDDIQQPKFDFWEVSAGGAAATDIKFIYAAHSRENMSDRIQLAGYYTHQYDAVLSAGRNGHVVALNIDQIEYEPEEIRVERKQDPSFKIFKEKQVEEPSILMDEELIPLPVATHERKPFLLLSLLIMILAGAIWMLFSHESVSVGVNQAQVDWLPPTCSNVSFFLSPTLEAYEFRCTSANFEAWVKRNGLHVRKIGENPVHIHTYRRYANVEMDPAIAQLPEDEKWEQWEAISRATVKAGYQIIGSNQATDWEIQGAYDWRSGIVYFWRKRQ